jgi:putative endonuclease
VDVLPAMQKSFLYIIRCSDGTLYTGYTTDPDRRVREHNAGRGSKYTRARLPAELVYLEQVSSRPEALRRESEIKKLPRGAKLLLCEGYRQAKRQSLR